MNKVLSKYTYLFKSSKGIYLIYNSRANAFIEVTRHIYDALQELRSEPFKVHPFSQEETNILLKHKILVDENEDENYWLQQKCINNQSLYSPEDLVLTIAPTTLCNFNCPYCYEWQKDPIKMSDEIITDLFHFINLHENAKRLHITWYGGEPLMAFDVIKKILEQLNKEIKIPLVSHSIVTNGYCFDQEVIDFFKKYDLSDMQITLDGTKEQHDRKRKLKIDGSGSYDKILENIKLITTEMPNTEVHIRVNIDKKNMDNFHSVWKTLKEKFPKENIYIYPGYIEIENKEHTCLICDSLLKEDARRLYYDLKYEYGEDVNFFPRIKHKGCGATSLYSYVIGPSGEYYKCWKNMGNPEQIIGFINRSYLKNPSLLHQYIISGNCMEDSKCKECFFFPICDGGCPDYRVKNKHNNGKFDLCTIYTLPNVLNECLELHYDGLQNKLNNG